MNLKKIVIATAMSLLTTPAFADAGKAYVTSQDGGVTIIDLETMTTTGSIDVKGEGPRGLGITDDGKLLIVATRENGSVSVIDTATNEVINQIKVGQNPEFVRVKGNLAFVSYEPSSKGGPPPVPGSAEALKAQAEEDDDDKEPARIGIIDLKQGKKIREITGGPETEGIEFSKDGKQLIITNEADNTITVHNIKTGKRIKTIKTHDYGDRPRGIKVSPDGKTYVATLEYGNKFLVMNKNFKVLRTVDTGATPYGISYDAAGKYIFVAENKAKLLEVFDAKTFEKVKEIPTGNRCWHFSFTPDDKQIMMACGKSDAIVLIDAQTLEPTKQVEVKKMPWGLVTYPKAMGSLDTKVK
ncbi:MAG: beta-propeller fold lactonase family protein [Methylotenera sp.]|nr:beta-propeller fold lactonase family protein [Methylotenera sp.]